MECNSVKNTPFLPLPDHSFLEGVGGGKSEETYHTRSILPKILGGLQHFPLDKIKKVVYNHEKGEFHDLFFGFNDFSTGPCRACGCFSGNQSGKHGEMCPT